MCRTSGCHCTPYSLRSSSSNAATGAPGVDAVTRTPSGAAVTASPWLIQTDWLSGWPANRIDAPSVTLMGVAPYSDRPVRCTVPPSARTIAWNP